MTLDFTASATFHTVNDDYFGGKTLEQDPVYAAQTYVSYDLGRGMWAALGATYYRGGRVTTDGVPSLVELGNTRAGAVLALPIDRDHSVKFNLSSSVHTHTGSEFTIFGMAWQYRWGAGN